jgi:hypothetical protein
MQTWVFFVLNLIMEWLNNYILILYVSTSTNPELHNMVWSFGKLRVDGEVNQFLFGCKISPKCEKLTLIGKILLLQFSQFSETNLQISRKKKSKKLNIIITLYVIVCRVSWQVWYCVSQYYHHIIQESQRPATKNLRDPLLTIACLVSKVF